MLRMEPPSHVPAASDLSAPLLAAKSITFWFGLTLINRIFNAWQVEKYRGQLLPGITDMPSALLSLKLVVRMLSMIQQKSSDQLISLLQVLSEFVSNQGLWSSERQLAIEEDAKRCCRLLLQDVWTGLCSQGLQGTLLEGVVNEDGSLNLSGLQRLFSYLLAVIHCNDFAIRLRLTLERNELGEVCCDVLS
jgi:hypothetical protein